MKIVNQSEEANKLIDHIERMTPKEREKCYSIDITPFVLPSGEKYSPNSK